MTERDYFRLILWPRFTKRDKQAGVLIIKTMQLTGAAYFLLLNSEYSHDSDYPINENIKMCSFAQMYGAP